MVTLAPLYGAQKVGQMPTPELQLSLFNHLFLMAGVENEERMPIIDAIRYRQLGADPKQAVEKVRVRFPRSQSTMIRLTYAMMNLDRIIIVHSIGD